MNRTSLWTYATVFGALLLAALLLARGAVASPLSREPVAAESTIRRAVDLDLGESQTVVLSDGSQAIVKLLQVGAVRESVTNTLTRAVVTVEINGTRADLISGNYQLPVTVGGVQVDAPCVAELMVDSHIDWWKLRKAARLRLWPAGSAWIEPGTFVYPVKQRWFASSTWFSNEPVSRHPAPGSKVYYHAGMDIGAAEGRTEVVAATDGVLLNIGLEAAPGGAHPAAQPRQDVVYVQDGRNWLYRYSHLMVIDPALRPGERVKAGQRLGYAGKEGSSGGWAHLHFHAESLQPSGEWGMEDSYAFLWQAYREQYDPPVIAVARPHHKALVGELVSLDASRSWSKTGAHSFEWLLSDGTTADGPVARRTYAQPGTYSEVVKVTDGNGNIDYDFASVRVYAGQEADGTASVVGVHVAFAPTLGIRPGDPVVFHSRGFHGRGPGAGTDSYDFGDGTPAVAVPSNVDAAMHAANGYGMVVHHYRAPGRYLVRVVRRDELTGFTATQHVQVVVEP